MCPLGLFIQLHWLLFCFISIIIRQWLLKLKCMQINWLVSIWRQHWKNCFSFTAVVKKSDEIIRNVFSQNQSLYDFCAHSQNFLKSRWNQREKKNKWILNVILKIYFGLMEVGVWYIIVSSVLLWQIRKICWTKLVRLWNHNRKNRVFERFILNDVV